MCQVRERFILMKKKPNDKRRKKKKKKKKKKNMVWLTEISIDKRGEGVGR